MFNETRGKICLVKLIIDYCLLVVGRAAGSTNFGSEVVGSSGFGFSSSSTSGSLSNASSAGISSKSRLRRPRVRVVWKLVLRSSSFSSSSPSFCKSLLKTWNLDDPIPFRLLSFSSVVCSWTPSSILSPCCTSNSWWPLGKRFSAVPGPREVGTGSNCRRLEPCERCRWLRNSKRWGWLEIQSLEELRLHFLTILRAIPPLLANDVQWRLCVPNDVLDALHPPKTLVDSLIRDVLHANLLVARVHFVESVGLVAEVIENVFRGDLVRWPLGVSEGHVERVFASQRRAHARNHSEIWVEWRRIVRNKRK